MFKFFLPELMYSDDRNAIYSAFELYNAYCKTIWHLLPLGMKQIQGDMLNPDVFSDSGQWISIHDASVEGFTFDANNKECRLSLIASSSEGYAMPVAIVYNNVSDVMFQLASVKMDDLGYHEVESLPNRTVVHRILFACGSTLTCVFGDCDVEISEVLDLENDGVQ